MLALAGLSLIAVATVAAAQDSHGCPEPVHDAHAYCSCLDNGRATAVRGYYQPRIATYRRPSYHPRPYPVAPEDPFVQPPYVDGPGPDYVVRGRPVYTDGPVRYVPGPRIYVDAPPVYVAPAQIYIERPEIIVRPSEVMMAPPEVHFEPCPEGAECYQAAPGEEAGAAQGD